MKRISFIPDPPERGPALSYDRVLKFTTPNGSGYLSFIVRDGTVNISPFLCDSTVTVNTTDGPVPASILNSVPAGDDDPDEDDPDEDDSPSTAEWFAESKRLGCTGTAFSEDDDTIEYGNPGPCPVHPGL